MVSVMNSAQKGVLRNRDHARWIETLKAEEDGQTRCDDELRHQEHGQQHRSQQGLGPTKGKCGTA